MMTVETNAIQSPEPLLSVAVRAGIALAVACLVGAGWLYAEHESRAAVVTSSAGLNAIRVTLPTVEIVGRRDAAKVAAATAERKQVAGKAL